MMLKETLTLDKFDRTKEAADDAIRTFHGQYIGHRKVKCSWAQHKQDPSANDYVTVDHSDPSNSNGETQTACRQPSTCLRSVKPSSVQKELQLTI